MSKYKIGVIGTINKDTVVLPDKSRYHGWGGILYNLIVLSSLMKGRADIYPACNVGQDCYQSIMKIVGAMPGVHADYIKKVSEKNNHCHLTYSDIEKKAEILVGGVPSLKYSDISGLLDCDMVLVNFISGRDIYLQSLNKFRQLYDGEIYIDIHSYTLGKKKDGSRFLRYPPGWMNLAEISDFIQMNAEELQLLSGSSKDMNRNQIEVSLKKLIKQLKLSGFDIQNKTIIVTDGGQGSYLCNIPNLALNITYYPVGGKAIEGDTTGCGDCFSSGFISELLVKKDLGSAVLAGSKAAEKRIFGEYDIL